MFFSWFIENRHFERNKSIKGQIAPFLIVILVILLTASIVTINIGRISIDKTSANNSADAGALASASAYAGAFNSLASMNETILWLTYQQNRVVMYDLYSEGDDIIDLAIIYAATALAFSLAGYYTVQASVPLCPLSFPPLITPTINYGYLVAMGFYITAASFCVLSAAEVQKFGVVCSYMRSIVDNHYENQKEYFQMICENMQEARTASNNTGYYFNFSNANISSKLSDVQGDQFSAWLSSEGYTSGSYSWPDKISQSHTVNASVSVPGISSYELMKTVYSYTQEGNLIDHMISTANTVNIIFNVESMLLWMAAGWLAAMTVASLLSVSLYYAGLALLSPPTTAAGLALIALAVKICFGTLWPMWTSCVAVSIAIVGNLMLIVGAGASAFLYFLKYSILRAYEGFFMNGIYSSSSCGDVDDILMVKIDSVTLPTWQTTSCAEQIHPGTSSGILNTSYPTLRSCARATFDSAGVGGGAIGSFSQVYDAELTSAY